jgi:predicted phosphodiesterase
MREMSPFENPNEIIARMRQDQEAALDGWVAPLYTDHLFIDSAHVLVAADTHIPKHDQELVEGMLRQAYEEEVDTIIWAGDLLDMEAYSSYGIDEKTASFKRDLRVTAAIIRGASRLGFKQYWTLGNHEQRLFRDRNMNNLDMSLLAQLAGLGDLVENGMLVTSDNPSVYLTIGNWLVTHPSQYGSYPTVVASKLATRNQANVIAAHEHHWGMTTDETGQWLAISSGGLYDPRKHKYINYQMTSHRAWQRGFVILHNGHAQLYRGAVTPLIQKREPIQGELTNVI